MYIKSKGAKACEPSTTEGLQSLSPEKILSFYVFTLSKIRISANFSTFNNSLDAI